MCCTYKSVTGLQANFPACVHRSQDEIDKWDFNVFEAESLTNHQPLRYVGYELFTKHELFKKHKVCIVSVPSDPPGTYSCM